MALTDNQRRVLRICLGSRKSDNNVADSIADELDSAPKLVSGVMEVGGTIIGAKDNATSLRVKGAQHSSEGGAQVQNYMGMFNNDSYDTVGTLKTRASFGGNLEMDIAIQSPHALLLIAQDGSQTDGIIKACSQNAVEFHCQYSAEELSPKRLIIDRISSAAKGTANTSDVVVKTNSGSLYLNEGVTDGAVVMPTLSTAERDALSGVVGMIIFNSDSNQFEGYDGAWKALPAA